MQREMPMPLIDTAAGGTLASLLLLFLIILRLSTFDLWRWAKSKMDL